MASDLGYPLSQVGLDLSDRFPLEILDRPKDLVSSALLPPMDPTKRDLNRLEVPDALQMAMNILRQKG